MYIVSFDFDETLSEPEVQQYVSKLLTHPELQVHIVTSRFSAEEYCKISGMREYYKDKVNKDLYSVTDELRIPRDHIFFLNIEPKYSWFKRQSRQPVFHVDDSPDEIERINATTLIVGIDVYSENWIQKCNSVLRGKGINI